MRLADNAIVGGDSLKPNVDGKVQVLRLAPLSLSSRFSAKLLSLFAGSQVINNTFITNELEKVLKVGRKMLPFSFALFCGTGLTQYNLSPDA
jgi:hypothetical protein